MQGYLLLLFAGVALAHRACLEDEDCAILGMKTKTKSTLKCVYSRCENMGICGCDRGYVARFAGSEKNFRCVKLKKVGEKCDTDALFHGWCGAMNSKCNKSRCRCEDGYESRWGGEICLPCGLDDLAPGESCSEDGQCMVGTCYRGNEWQGARAGNAPGTHSSPLNDLRNYPLDDLPGVCSCGDGYETSIPNDFSAAYWLGRKMPTCNRIKVEGLCISDLDCAHIRQPAEGLSGTGWVQLDSDGNQAATCISNKCECSTNGYVYDITGQFCGPPLAKGDDCAWGNQMMDSSWGICDGSQGLTCGDACDVDTYVNGQNYTCVCDRGYVDSGSGCTAVTEGTACVGDWQCKSLDYNAICHATKGCRNGAPAMAVTMATLMLPLLVFFHLFK